MERDFREAWSDRARGIGSKVWNSVSVCLFFSVSHWWGATLSKALMWCTAVLAWKLEREVALSTNIWNLLENLSPWHWLGAQVLCPAISISPSALLSVEILFSEMLGMMKTECERHKFRTVVFFSGDFPKTVHCSTRNEGMGLDHGVL